MSCPDRDEIMRWLDGELPEGRRAELEDHLGSCGECRSLLESQRLIESAWRESWKDPDETAFESMRRGILSPPPWWKRQRTWFAVAAVFSVYFGVRVFFLDGSGAPMSRYAEEAMPTVTVTGERPLLEDASVEQTGDAETAPEGHTAGEPAAAEDDSPVPEPVEEAEEEVFSADAYAQDISPVEDSVEEITVDSGLAGLTGASSSSADEAQEMECIAFEEVSSSDGYGYSGPGIGSGGGGSAQVSRAPEENLDDLGQSAGDQIRNMEMACTASPPAGPAYLVMAVFPDGSADTLLREEWADLFAMIDSIWTGEDITLELDSALTEDTLYLDCIIHVTGY